jgi:hypothetical protein
MTGWIPLCSGGYVRPDHITRIEPNDNGASLTLVDGAVVMSPMLEPQRAWLRTTPTAYAKCFAGFAS